MTNSENNFEEEEKLEIQLFCEKLISGIPRERIWDMEFSFDLMTSDFDYFDPEDIGAHTNPVFLLSQKLDAQYEPDISSRARSQWYALLAKYTLNHWDTLAPEPEILDFYRQAFIQARYFDEKAKVTEFHQKAQSTKASTRANNQKHFRGRALRRLTRIYARQEINRIAVSGESISAMALAGLVWDRISCFNRHKDSNEPVIGMSKSGFDEAVAQDRVYRWILSAIKDGELTLPK